MPANLESQLKAEAARLGFSLSGIAPATDADSFDRFEAWLDSGYAGEMDYLQRHRDARRNPASILVDVRSVVMLGIEYSSAAHGKPLPEHHGKVARYAQGPDYHEIVREKLNALSLWLNEHSPGTHSRGVVDTAPLLERDFARRAGLGWIGKNTMLIHPRHGSYFFLAALLTSLPLETDPAFDTNHCGTCTACLDACPTQAFPKAGVLDATKCISYWTIEYRGPIPLAMHDSIGDWLFGCDVCQEVCPWNRFAGGSAMPHDGDLISLDCLELLSLTESDFRTRFHGYPFLRTKRSGLLRNAAIALGNRGDQSALPALRIAQKDQDPAIQQAAEWAVVQIMSGRKIQR